MSGNMVFVIDCIVTAIMVYGIYRCNKKSDDKKGGRK